MFQAVGARSAPFQRRTHALVPRSRCRASPLTQQRSSNAITLDVLGRSRMDHDIRRGSLLRWATARRVRSPHTDQAVAVAAAAAEAATFWSPTQNYFATYLDGSSVYGFNQAVDLTLGLSAALSPLPRARFSPYVMLGVYARQTWSHGANSFRNPDGSFAWNDLERSRTVGDILAQVGIGIRARVGGRMFQVEMRQFSRRSLTLGTHLPF